MQRHCRCDLGEPSFLIAIVEPAEQAVVVELEIVQRFKDVNVVECRCDSEFFMGASIGDVPSFQ